MIVPLGTVLNPFNVSDISNSKDDIKYLKGNCFKSASEGSFTYIMHNQTHLFGRNNLIFFLS